jgi:hypothetical protein
MFDFRNYSGCCQIISGLNNVAVARLRKLVASVPEKTLAIMTKLSAQLDPKDNYSLYRNLSRHVPCIPLIRKETLEIFNIDIKIYIVYFFF